MKYNQFVKRCLFLCGTGILFLLVSCFFPSLKNIPQSSGMSSTGSFFISGTVMTDPTGDGVTGAVVTLSGTMNANCTTIAGGVFSFTGLKSGNYKINVEYPNNEVYPLFGSTQFTLSADRNDIHFGVKTKAELEMLPDSEYTLISEIQGEKHISQYDGLTVQFVPGIVTAQRIGSYDIYTEYQELYIESPYPDNNRKTSEGIRILSSYNPDLAGSDYFVPGDLILIKEAVITESKDNKPYGSYYNENCSATMISCHPRQIIKLASGLALPDPVILGEMGRAIPHEEFCNDAVSGSLEDPETVFDPDEDVLDFFESLEHMRVTIQNPLVVGATTEFNDVAIVADRGIFSGAKTRRGGLVIGENYDDFNPEIITITENFVTLPALHVGDIFTGDITGIIDYSYRKYKVVVTEPLPPYESYLRKEVAALEKNDNTLTVASFNVENLSPVNSSNGSVKKMEGIAEIIAYNLLCPDILGLIEVQDNSGNLDDGDASCDITMKELITAIHSLPGVTANYDYCTLNPFYGEEGGEPVGNIRVVFLYNKNRVGFDIRPDKNDMAQNPHLVHELPSIPAAWDYENNELHLVNNPSRIEPQSDSFSYTRRSLIAEFDFKGQPVFITANHFSSKGRDYPLHGIYQPPVRSSEEKREEQAAIIHDFIEEGLSYDSEAMIIALGDFNDFHFSPVLSILSGTLLTNLVFDLPPNERYSYVYEGNSQILDCILVSDALYSGNHQIDIVHVNAEYPFEEQVSDHDPLLAAFQFGPDIGDNEFPYFTGTTPALDIPKCYKVETTCRLNESGWQYYAAFPEGTYIPGAGEIRNGFDIYGYPFSISGLVFSAGETDYSYYIDNLSPETSYDIFFVAEDTSFNLSRPVIQKTITTAPLSSRPIANDLFISEYVEGSSYSKAIEIANYTGSSVDLSIYSIRRDSNGSGVFGIIESLSGILANNDVHIIRCEGYRQYECDSAIIEVADQSTSRTGALGFNGNDQVGLFKSGVEIDRIGVSESEYFGQNVTYVRKDTVKEGKTGEQDPRFNGEWISYAIDTFSFLDWHRYDP